MGAGAPAETALEESIAREIGAPTAEALVAFGERRYGDAARELLALRPRLRRIGGSNAQRDLFEQVLIEACVREGMNQQGALLLSERIVVRGTNRFAEERIARYAIGYPSESRQRIQV